MAYPSVGEDNTRSLVIPLCGDNARSLVIPWFAHLYVETIHEVYYTMACPPVCGDNARSLVMPWLAHLYVEIIHEV